jgi:hypothetical protein
MPASPDPAERKPRGSCLPIAFVLALAALVFGGLVILSGGNFLPAAIAAGAIFGALTLPYLVWGWWLGRYLREKESRGQDTGFGGQGRMKDEG